MSFATIPALMLAVGICFLPVWLLRRFDCKRAQDYLVSSGYTPPAVVRNSSIAYALRMAAFGALFAWGATGDPWPAIAASASFALGVGLLYAVRGPLLAFLDRALHDDRSITVHEFIAQEHGNDPRVRLLAASLTVCALLGLMVGDALALAAFLDALLPGSAWVDLFAFGAVLFSVLYAIPAGHSGAMHSAQLQLGILYLGLFGATVLLLYLHVAALTPVSPHGRLAVVVVAIACAIILCYRRSKYVDTGLLRGATDGRAGRCSLGARLLSRLEKLLNPWLSVLLVLIVVVALMELYAAGLPATLRDGAAALQTEARLTGAGLIALVLLPLFYPLVDVTNWQRLAALHKNRDANGVEPVRGAAELRRVLRGYAGESALLWLFMSALGAIAMIAINAPRGAHGLQELAAQFAADDSRVAAAVLTLLLICAFAAALSTLSALLSASLCTIRYDMLAAFWPELAPGPGYANESIARRRALIAGGALALAVAVGFWVADAAFQVSVASNAFLGALFALCCAQLAFAPLVLGPLVGRMRGGSGGVRPGWALAILGAGAGCGAAGAAVYLLTGTEAWLWATVPVCLGSGLALFAIARALTWRSGAIAESRHAAAGEPRRR
jgi:hypothetical protein